MAERLTGLSAESLMSYLAALGTFRTLAEQYPNVKARWDRGSFTIDGPTRAQIEEFFRYQYAPTPLVTPWNAGSGFLPGAQTANARALAALERSSSLRLAPYRDVIALARKGMEAYNIRDKRQLKAKKAQLMAWMRDHAPDRALDWFDAAYALGSSDPRYSPLLGSGGNDGNLEFVGNFMLQIGRVLPLTATAPTESQDSVAWLRNALWGDAAGLLKNEAIGQFHPGGAGGVNATVGFESDSLVNPWTYVLMMEGSLVFSGGMARRLSAASRGRPSFPFMAPEASPLGAGGAGYQGEKSRGEVWLPLWEQWAGYREVRFMFAEGRAQVGTRQAHSGIDFGRAAVSLGVDRGITAFQRVGLLERNGRSFFAVNLGAIRVREGTQARLIEQLDPWLASIPDADVSNRVGVAKHRVLQDIFTYCQRVGISEETRLLQDILVSVGNLEWALGAGAKHNSSFHPLYGLTDEWLTAADDGSLEFTLALSMAGTRAIQRLSVGDSDRTTPGTWPVRSQLEPVVYEKGRWKWTGDGPLIAGWAQGETQWIDIHWKRTLAAHQVGDAGGLGSSQSPVDAKDVATLLADPRPLEWDRILPLVMAFVSLRATPHAYPVRAHADEVALFVPPSYTVLKLALLERSRFDRVLMRTPGTSDLPDPVPVRLMDAIRRGRWDEAIQLAYHRLRTRDVSLRPIVLTGTAEPLNHLGFALSLDIRYSALSRLARAVLSPAAADHEISVVTEVR